MDISKYSIKRTDIFLLCFLVVIIVITILCALNPNFGQYFSLNNWFDLEALGDVDIFAAIIFTMIVCFLGALIPIPIPYPAPITLFAAVWLHVYGLGAWFFIIILVLFATLSNTIGDLVDYFIGHGTQSVLSKDDPELQSRWAQIILKKPKAIPWIILLFGLTPLPDVALMIPLGFVKYDVKKTMIWMFVSRFFMLLAFALAGILALDFLSLLEGSDDGTGWISGVILLYVVWGIIVAMVKITPKQE